MEHTESLAISLVGHPMGWVLLAIFVIGYYFIAAEDKYHLDKSKTALFIGTLMFVLIGVYYVFKGVPLTLLETAVDHLILEISQIFFFLLVAMVYIETLVERGVLMLCVQN